MGTFKRPSIFHYRIISATHIFEKLGNWYFDNFIECFVCNCVKLNSCLVRIMPVRRLG